MRTERQERLYRAVDRIPSLTPYWVGGEEVPLPWGGPAMVSPMAAPPPPPFGNDHQLRVYRSWEVGKHHDQ